MYHQLIPLDPAPGTPRGENGEALCTFYDWQSWFTLLGWLIDHDTELPKAKQLIGEEHCLRIANALAQDRDTNYLCTAEELEDQINMWITSGGYSQKSVKLAA